jgi:hypothetical protein
VVIDLRMGAVWTSADTTARANADSLAVAPKSKAGGRRELWHKKEKTGLSFNPNRCSFIPTQNDDLFPPWADTRTIHEPLARPQAFIPVDAGR